MQSVRNSSRMLEEASSVGEAILSKYSEQREFLKVSAILHTALLLFALFFLI